MHPFASHGLAPTRASRCDSRCRVVCSSSARSSASLVMLLQSLFLAVAVAASTCAAANATWLRPKKGQSIVYAINDASLPASPVTKSGLKLDADIYIVDVRHSRCSHADGTSSSTRRRRPSHATSARASASSPTSAPAATSLAVPTLRASTRPATRARRWTAGPSTGSTPARRRACATSTPS